MKKFLVLLSWSRKAAIGSMLIMAFAVVGCGDDESWSPSARANDDSSEVTSSSSEKAKSSSSDIQSDAKQSSSSEKTGTSSSGVNEDSSSSVKSGSSSSVIPGNAPESSSSLAKSSSSNAKSSSSSVEVQPASSEPVANSSSSVSELSSSSLDGFDWNLPKEAYLNPEIEYDTIIDPRDGKVYKTVKIGDQVWMAENLNFDPGRGSSSDAKYDWSWCYNNEPKNCDVAGRFYTWAAAIDSVKLVKNWGHSKKCGYGTNCNLTEKVQGVCPPNWHLPTYDEWEALFVAVSGQSALGEALKSQRGWGKNGNGVDSFGFSALPAGYSLSDYQFYSTGFYAYFWSSTEFMGATLSYGMELNSGSVNAYLNYRNYRYYGFSVRCLKD
jgi:uncharacterized protein (TIGR02145 family)